MFPLPLSLQYDFTRGSFTPFEHYSERRLSDLAELFHDQEAVRRALKRDDPLVYDWRAQPFQTPESDLTFGVTRIYPGQVGGEYFMTRGHFHLQRALPEIYFCLQGTGMLLLESEAGAFQAVTWTPGTVSHIPPHTAHRAVNTGDTILVFAAVYQQSAGHDYKTVAQRGFAQLVVAREGKPVLVANPRRGE